MKTHLPVPDPFKVALRARCQILCQSRDWQRLEADAKFTREQRQAARWAEVVLEHTFHAVASACQLEHQSNSSGIFLKATGAV